MIPAHETLYLPVQIKTTEDASYLVASIYCDDEITLGITDLDQFTKTVKTEGEHVREKITLDKVGVYWAFLSNETDHDITVDQIHFTNSEYETPDGRSVADIEKAGVIHWN